MFKTLVGKEVTVEMKNDVSIRGTLHSVDQFLNVRLTNITVVDGEKYPHLMSVSNCFIRGSVVRYFQIPKSHLELGLLQDATRRELLASSSKA